MQIYTGKRKTSESVGFTLAAKSFMVYRECKKLPVSLFLFKCVKYSGENRGKKKVEKVADVLSCMSDSHEKTGGKIWTGFRC